MHHSAARAKTVRIVDRAIADAVGIGLDVFSAKGIFVVNFGGETTELSVLSGGKNGAEPSAACGRCGFR